MMVTKWTESYVHVPRRYQHLLGVDRSVGSYIHCLYIDIYFRVYSCGVVNIKSNDFKNSIQIYRFYSGYESGHFFFGMVMMSLHEELVGTGELMLLSWESTRVISHCIEIHDMDNLSHPSISPECGHIHPARG